MEEILLDFIDHIFGTSPISADNLKFSNDELSMIQPITKYISIIAVGMTLVYFLMEMNEKLALDGRDINFKTFAAPFLKLGIAIFVLSHGSTIIGGILSVNNDFVEEMAAQTFVASSTPTPGEGSSGGDAEDDSKEKMKEIVKSYNFLQQIGVFTPLFLMYVISLVLGLVWWYKSTVYKLEVLFRVGIAPISFSDVYSGSNSVAVKYTKEFLVLGIYGASMIILPKMTTSMAVTNMASITSLWDGIKTAAQTAFVLPFAALSCTSLIRTAAKEALGA